MSFDLFLLPVLIALFQSNGYVDDNGLSLSVLHHERGSVAPSQHALAVSVGPPAPPGVTPVVVEVLLLSAEQNVVGHPARGDPAVRHVESREQKRGVRSIPPSTSTKGTVSLLCVGHALSVAVVRRGGAYADVHEKGVHVSLESVGELQQRSDSLSDGHGVVDEGRPVRVLDCETWQHGHGHGEDAVGQRALGDGELHDGGAAKGRGQALAPNRAIGQAVAHAYDPAVPTVGEHTQTRRRLLQVLTLGVQSEGDLGVRSSVLRLHDVSLRVLPLPSFDGFG